jgi:hypothetical protein
MSRRQSTTRAGAAVKRALDEHMGPGSAEQLALAQVRVAWDEVMEASRLARPPLSSRVKRVTGGTAHIEASDPMLAQELTLRRDALIWALNQRMSGRPGATIVLLGLAVSVGRGGPGSNL